MATVGEVKDNTLLYTGVGAAAGAAAGGASGYYYLAKALKDNAATDSFVRYVADNAKDGVKTALDNASKVKPELTAYLEGLKDSAKTVVPTAAEELKTFREGIITTLKGHGLEGDVIKKGVEGITNTETLKAFSENATKLATSNAQKSTITGLFKDGKIVVEGLDGEKKTLAEGVQKLLGGFKKSAALKWAAIGAVALGIASYILSPKRSNKDAA